MGAVHKRVKTLRHAINDAKAGLMAVGQVQCLYRGKNTIRSLVSKLKVLFRVWHRDGTRKFAFLPKLYR